MSLKNITIFIFLVTSILFASAWELELSDMGFSAIIEFDGNYQIENGLLQLAPENACPAIEGFYEVPISSRIFVVPIGARAFLKYEVMEAETLFGVTLPTVPPLTFESDRIDNSIMP